MSGPVARCALAALAAQVALAAGTLGCARPRYLGAPVPDSCTKGGVEDCLGWMMERDLLAAELGIYDDAPLRAYVQSIADRLTPASLLERPPRVVLAAHDDTYATSGRRIVIARSTIERLDSEAEVAAILAHELAHLEASHVMVSLYGRPPAPDPAADRRDAEAVADERAVWLLERAGYAPSAMARALAAVLEAEDEEHPPRVVRIARVKHLAGGRGGVEARDALLRHVEGMVAGRDPRRGQRVGDAWVVPVLGLALPLRATDAIRSANALLVMRRGRAPLVAYAIGMPWARELAGTLDERTTANHALGRLTTGVVPPVRDHADVTPFGKLARAIRGTLPQPSPGTRVAILERERGALVLELAGSGDPELALRAATVIELALTTPRRIVLERAPRAGTLAELGVCPGRLLETPARRVARGELVRCADRLVPDLEPPAPPSQATDARAPTDAADDDHDDDLPPPLPPELPPSP